jgi:hypothetical protein
MAVSLSSVDTEYSADSIEFSRQHPSIFVCGTYQIQQIVESAPAAASDQPDSTSPSHELAGLSVDDKDTDSETSDDDETLSPPTRRLGRMLLYEVGEDRSSL